jgi:hypothetical protein
VGEVRAVAQVGQGVAHRVARHGRQPQAA